MGSVNKENVNANAVIGKEEESVIMTVPFTLDPKQFHDKRLDKIKNRKNERIVQYARMKQVAEEKKLMLGIEEKEHELNGNIESENEIDGNINNMSKDDGDTQSKIECLNEKEDI